MYEPILFDEDKDLNYGIADNLIAHGDTTRLQQAVYILLDNAKKLSTPRGAIDVRLSKSEHKRLLLKVSNEGVPISKEELKKIFLRFYRQDESRSGYGSFGLGLSIAQSIVYGHQGTIWAESDGKSRNIFNISLPLA